MSDEDDEATADESACPFCASTGGCEHSLLHVDLTFRTSEGGALFEAFEDRWSTITDREDDDFNERESFNELLEEVDSLSDASLEYVFEGGPGMTSEYGMYFCSSKERVAAAVKKFEAASAAHAELEGDRCPLCHKINAPASGETCEHHVGWKWDGAFDLDDDLDELQRSWQEVGEYIRRHAGEPEFDELLTSLMGVVAHRQKLVDLAAGDSDFSELLEEIGVDFGGGWQTRGMLGGSGYNLYMRNLQPVKDATALYDELCQLAEKFEDKLPTEPVPTPVAVEQIGRKRAVLIITTQWPSGTMAFKFGYRIVLELQTRRVNCRHCGGVKLERLDFLADNPRYTERFAMDVGARCRRASVRDVGRELGLDWHTVKTLEKQYMRAQLAATGTPSPAVIGIDEISVRRGHTYRIIVSDLIARRPMQGLGYKPRVRRTGSVRGQHGKVLHRAGAGKMRPDQACRHGHVEAVPQRYRG